LIHNEKLWTFTREVLLEIKRQKENKLNVYPQGDGLAYNVALLLDRDITIEGLGKY